MNGDSVSGRRVVACASTVDWIGLDCCQLAEERAMALISRQAERQCMQASMHCRRARRMMYGAVLAKSSHPIYFSIPSHRGWVQLTGHPWPTARSVPPLTLPPLETTCGQSCRVRWAAFAGEGILARGWGPWTASFSMECSVDFSAVIWGPRRASFCVCPVRARASEQACCWRRSNMN